MRHSRLAGLHCEAEPFAERGPDWRRLDVGCGRPRTLIHVVVHLWSSAIRGAVCDVIADVSEDECKEGGWGT